MFNFDFDRIKNSATCRFALAGIAAWFGLFFAIPHVPPAVGGLIAQGLSVLPGVFSITLFISMFVGPELFRRYPRQMVTFIGTLCGAMAAYSMYQIYMTPTVAWPPQVITVVVLVLIWTMVQYPWNFIAGIVAMMLLPPSGFLTLFICFMWVNVSVQYEDGGLF